MNQDPINRLIALLRELPGVGEKTASRLAYFILRAKGSYAQDLARAITEMKESVVLCSQCRNLTPDDPCRICASPERDRSLIMVVEEPHDLWAVEKTGTFRGLYHVLHGTLSPLKNQGPQDIEIEPLLQRVRTGEVKEVILGTNPNVEGEATANYLVEALAQAGRPKDAGPSLKITRIARGIPVGADLEYVDRQSLEQAIRGRREV